MIEQTNEAMMKEIIRKQQLTQLKNQLSSIEGQVNDFNSNLENLKIEIKKHLLVDDLIIEEKTYNKIVDNNNLVISNINEAKSIVSSKL